MPAIFGSNIPEMNDAKWPSEQKNELILFGLHF